MAVGESEGFWKWVAEFVVAGLGWVFAVVIWQVKPSNAQVQKMIEAALLTFAKADLDAEHYRNQIVEAQIAGLRALVVSNYDSVKARMDSNSDIAKSAWDGITKQLEYLNEKLDRRIEKGG